MSSRFATLIVWNLLAFQTLRAKHTHTNFVKTKQKDQWGECKQQMGGQLCTASQSLLLHRGILVYHTWCPFKPHIFYIAPIQRHSFEYEWMKIWDNQLRLFIYLLAYLSMRDTQQGFRCDSHSTRWANIFTDSTHSWIWKASMNTGILRVSSVWLGDIF